MSVNMGVMPKTKLMTKRVLLPAHMAEVLRDVYTAGFQLSAQIMQGNLWDHTVEQDVANRFDRAAYPPSCGAACIRPVSLLSDLEESHLTSGNLWLVRSTVELGNVVTLPQVLLGWQAEDTLLLRRAASSG